MSQAGLNQSRSVSHRSYPPYQGQTSPSLLSLFRVTPHSATERSVTQRSVAAE